MSVRVVNSGPGVVSVSVEATPAIQVSSPEVSVVEVTAGLQGPKGDTGATGATGAAGATGATGAPGVGVAAGGLEGQFLVKRSNTDYDTTWDYVESTYLQVQNAEATAIAAGTVVYAFGVSGSNITVKKADARNSSTMPVIGVVLEEIASGSAGEIITSGLFNKTISGLSGTINVGDTVYVSETAGGVTTTKPTGTALIQNIGVVLKTSGSNIQKMKVSAIDRVNDIPNIPNGQAWIGNASGVATPTTLASVATSGSYSDLSGTPTIPSTLGGLTGNSDDITQGATNLYMKQFNSLGSLTGTVGTETPSDTLADNPDKVLFSVVNKDVDTVAKKTSFEDMLAAIVQSGITTVVGDGYGSLAMYEGPTGIVGDFDGNGIVNASDLLTFLSLFGNSWGATVDTFQKTSLGIGDTAGSTKTPITDTYTNLDLPSAIVVTQGTQTVTVSTSTDLITIESSTSEMSISAWPQMYLHVNGLFRANATQASERVDVRLSINLYNSSGTSLGSGTIDLGNSSSLAAGSDFYVPVQVTIDNSAVAEATGVANGWGNTSVDKIAFSFQAKEESGLGSLIWFYSLPINFDINP